MFKCLTPFMVIIVFFNFVTASESVKNTTYCLTKHLKEAKELNQLRLPLYSKITKGKSLQISRELIASESLALVGAYYFDWVSEKYQRQKIPIMCKEIISMGKVPVFKEKKEISGLVPDLETLHLKSNILEITSLISIYTKPTSEEDFNNIKEIVLNKLRDIHEYPDFFCMLRHLLESIYITAETALEYQVVAEKMGMEDPTWISWRFIWGQIQLFSFANRLDQLAYPLQKEGVSIICQDVPPLCRILQGSGEVECDLE